MADQLYSSSATVPTSGHEKFDVDDPNEVTVKGLKFV